MFGISYLYWGIFLGFVFLMLAIDLGVFHRNAHAVSTKEAAIWSAVWISLGLLFSVVIYNFWHTISPGSLYTDKEAALAYLTGYIIEKSLSVDNIFVFVLIFSYFALPAKYQHRVLYWGILGALVMRGLLIFTGAALLEQFHWVIYLFGAFLIFTGWRMARSHGIEVRPEENPLVKLVRRFLPVSDAYDGQKFFTRRQGQRLATPLLIVLVVIESTDLVFAVDSIPAIFAVTQNPFIVFTSNIFAILGLRSLYFLLASVIDRFYYLKYGLSVILMLVGIKMVIVDIYKVPTAFSLGMVATVLTLSILASWQRNRQMAGVFEN
ncbi:MAG: TerC family protein [Caldilineales bacterium]|nr:TerC family protein [Caldilineales bacterium]